jgi:hypothetical protein
MSKHILKIETQNDFPDDLKYVPWT